MKVVTTYDVEEGKVCTINYLGRWKAVGVGDNC